MASKESEYEVTLNDIMVNLTAVSYAMNLALQNLKTSKRDTEEEIVLYGVRNAIEEARDTAKRALGFDLKAEGE